MEAFTTELDVQIKLLKFTQGKTKGIVEKGNSEGIERQRDAHRAIVKKIENVKTQIEQAKLESGVGVGDNGKTFVGASKWIEQGMKDERIHGLLAQQGIEWKFN